MDKTNHGLFSKRLLLQLSLTLLTFISILSLSLMESPSSGPVIRLSYYGAVMGTQGKWQIIPLEGEFEVISENLGFLGTINTKTDRSMLALPLTNNEDIISLLPISTAYDNLYQFDYGQNSMTWDGQSDLDFALFGHKIEGFFQLHDMVDGVRTKEGGSYQIIDSKGNIILEFITNPGEVFPFINLAHPLPLGSYILRQVEAPKGTQTLEDLPFEINIYKNPEDITNLFIENFSLSSIAYLDAELQKAASLKTPKSLDFLKIIAGQDHIDIHIDAKLAPSGNIDFALTLPRGASLDGNINFPLNAQPVSRINTDLNDLIVFSYPEGINKSETFSIPLKGNFIDSSLLTYWLCDNPLEDMDLIDSLVVHKDKYNDLIFTLMAKDREGYHTYMAELPLEYIFDKSSNINLFFPKNNLNIDALIADSSSEIYIDTAPAKLKPHIVIFPAEASLTAPIDTEFNIYATTDTQPRPHSIWTNIKDFTGNLSDIRAIAYLEPIDTLKLNLHFSTPHSSGDSYNFISLSEDISKSIPIPAIQSDLLESTSIRLYDDKKDIEDSAIIMQEAQLIIKLEEDHTYFIRDIHEDGTYPLKYDKSSNLQNLYFKLPPYFSSLNLISDFGGLLKLEDISNFEIPIASKASISITIENLESSKGLAHIKAILSHEDGLSYQSQTDEKGQLIFQGLEKGTYHIFLELPESLKALGYIEENQDTYHTSIYVDEGSHINHNIGFTYFSSLNLNLKGEIEENIELTLSRGELSYALNESEDISYQRNISKLIPGKYSLNLSIPENIYLSYVDEAPVLKKGNYSFDVTLIQGENNLALHFDKLSSLSLSAKGIYSHSALSAVITGPEYRQLITKDGENIHIDGLLPGEYELELTLPSESILEDFSAENWSIENHSITTSFTVIPGQNLSLPNIIIPTYGAILGEVFDDLVKNGIRDSYDEPFSQVAISLEKLKDNGKTFSKQAETVTDSQGQYSFSKLLPGRYRLAVELPADTVLSTKTEETTRRIAYMPAFNLDYGEHITLEDIGLAGPYGIKATAFLDSNLNGQRGIYEQPIEGTLVEIFDSQHKLISTAHTDAEGDVLIRNILPGEYYAQFTLPSQYWIGPKGDTSKKNTSLAEQVDSSTGITDIFQVERANITHILVGGEKLGTIEGKLFEDTDGDGILTENDKGLKGTYVHLEGKRSGKVYTLEADEEGFFTLTARPETFILTFNGPPGYVFTRYSATGGGDRSLFTTFAERIASKNFILTAGETNIVPPVGWLKAASIEIFLFEDENYNGHMDEGEFPYKDGEIYLYRSGKFSAIAKANPDENGHIVFDNLLGGSYRLVANIDKGYSYSTLPQSPRENTISNYFEAGFDRRQKDISIEISDGSINPLGLGVVTTGSIKGRVFIDEDFDGIFNSNLEKSFSGLNVNLLDSEDNIVAREKSGRQGEFTFDKLYPGEYRLSFALPKDYTATIKGEGEGGSLLEKVEDSTAYSETLHLPMGENLTDLNLGLIESSSISLSAYIDEADDGLLDETDQAYENLYISLLDEDGRVIESAYTDSFGKHTFQDLLPGKYAVLYGLDENQAPSRSLLSSYTNSDDNTSFLISDYIILKRGEKVVLDPLGVINYASISFTSFEDKNGDGFQDKDEIKRSLNSINVSYLEDDSSYIKVYELEPGSYLIDKLRPGDYELTIILEQGYVFTREGKSSLINQPGTAYASRSISLKNGENLTNYTLGMVKPATIKGMVWLDKDDDGLYTDEDMPAKGEKVYALDESTGEVIAQAITDAKGNYELNNLLPGSYSLYIRPGTKSTGIDHIDSMNSFYMVDDLYMHKNLLLTEDSLTSNINAGLIYFSSLSGRAWLDRQGSIEPLEDVAISLKDLAHDTIIYTIDTNEKGEFTFSSLRPGTYAIQVSPVKNYLLLKAEDFTENRTSIISDVNQATSDSLALPMGSHISNLDISFILPAKLGDILWLDENSNGLQDSHERVLSGVSIHLYQRGELVDTVVTDDYGYYLFDKVYPTLSQIKVPLLDGVIPTLVVKDQPLITNALTSHDDDFAYTDIFPLKSGESNFNMDLGFALKDKNLYPKEAVYPPSQNWQWGQ